MLSDTCEDLDSDADICCWKYERRYLHFDNLPTITVYEELQHYGAEERKIHKEGHDGIQVL